MHDSEIPVENLLNIGPQTASWLRSVGIGTRGELERVGAPMAFRMMKHHHRGVNRLALYALAGALEDRHWNSFASEEKACLIREADGDLRIRYEA